MTATVEAIFALCTSVSEATSAEEEALRGASTSPAFAVIEIVRIPGEVSLDHVAVQLAEPVRLPELEAAFGPGRKLPTRPDGGSMRTVIFDDTVPAEGSTGATLLADVQGSDLVVRLVVRRDVL